MPGTYLYTPQTLYAKITKNIKLSPPPYELVAVYQAWMLHIDLLYQDV